MISPLKNGRWVEFESLDSTQDYAIQTLDQSNIGVVFAYHQIKGRGRFHRKWESEHHTSLSMTLVLREYSDHPYPWLLGMTLAIAAAQTLHLQLQWPNDLVLNQKKVGGIITEVVHRVPLVGIGINLNQSSFLGEYQQTPTSIYLERNEFSDPKQTALQILSILEHLPGPNQWKDIEHLWKQRDATLQKLYTTPNGKTFQAVGIGDQGELIINTPGGEEKVSLAYYLENRYTFSSE